MPYQISWIGERTSNNTPTKTIVAHLSKLNVHDAVVSTHHTTQLPRLRPPHWLHSRFQILTLQLMSVAQFRQVTKQLVHLHRNPGAPILISQGKIHLQISKIQRNKA